MIPIPHHFTFLIISSRGRVVHVGRLRDGPLGGTVPDTNLRSTAQHFLDRLPSDAYAKIQDLMIHILSGQELRLGTTCSGMDGVYLALKSVMEVLCDCFNVKQVWR